MDCSVEECGSRDAKPLGGKDEYALCSVHKEGWGYYRLGYYEALDKESDGCLHRPLWRKAMVGFLEHCRTEIIALTQIGEAMMRSDSEVTRESKYDGWLATMRIPAEVSALELSVLANRLGVDVDAVRNKHIDELFDDLLARIKEKGVIQEKG